MLGGRKTHDYPNGRPLPLVLINIAMGFVGIVWVMFAFGSWMRGLGIIGIFLALAFMSSKLHQTYERTGQAVPIPRAMTITRFDNGMPAPLLALRVAFFVVVAAMVGFGVAPLSDWTARRGVIGCILGVVAIGIFSVALERYYVQRGRGEDIPIKSSDSKAVSKSASQH